MTLVIYKNNIIAADSRGTIKMERVQGNCVHCDTPVEKAVNHDKNKIRLITKEIQYRGSKVLAVAGSGNAGFTTAMINFLIDGEDIHRIFKQHCSLLKEEPLTAAFLIVTVDEVHILRTYNPKETSKRRIRDFFAESFKRHETAMIGSGAYEARILDKFTNSELSATELIELTKEHNDSVGGNIYFHDFTAGVPDLTKFNSAATRFTKSKIVDAIKSIS